ncbi:MAG: LysM peptidoglycan-binding domain-containing protein [Bacteroidetes bacterium]|nr:LysM peptidoglycan-binding domain-containing protein [Bacteroidota bacterium]
MVLPGRKYSAGSGYKYGFNGQEKEKEINDNIITAEFWEYETRIARRWNIDPVIKTYESPCSTFENCPLYIMDHNGADSTLASGSNSWQWKIEKLDTYKSIVKRTGIKLKDLMKWNNIKSTKVPLVVGNSLNLSDPSICPMSDAVPPININNVGTVSVIRYQNNEIYLTLCPNDEKEKDSYKWFQTYETNDPVQRPPTMKYPNGGDPNRALVSPPYEGNDIDGGMRAAAMANKLKLVFSEKASDPNKVSTLDQPQRPPTSTGTIWWNGTLSIVKKVNKNYVVVATFTYGFTVHPNGDQYTHALEFNPVRDKNSAAAKSHQEKLDNFSLTH